VKQLRIGFALGGFVAALFSVALDDHRLGWVAIGLLAIALILRLLRKRENGSSPSDPPV
jgi:uncharacterized membrane protein YfcA